MSTTDVAQVRFVNQDDDRESFFVRVDPYFNKTNKTFGFSLNTDDFNKIPNGIYNCYYMNYLRQWQKTSTTYKVNREKDERLLGEE